MDLGKCKTCGGTGWTNLDLKSDSLRSMVALTGIDCELACPDCAAGRAELEQAKLSAKSEKNKGENNV